MRHTASTSLSGQQLVADFQNVCISQATIEAAQYEATRSEDELNYALSSLAGDNYLSPSAMSVDARDNVTRASVDAHLKKFQAQQLMSMSVQQLQALVENDQAAYKGRKAQITVLPGMQEVIFSIWFNQQTGYRNSITKKTKLTGTIETVLLDQNLLVIRPRLLPRLLNSELQQYAVRIINPASLQPMVACELL
jgi:hypothetical protein